jgi:hypothetical protein
MKPKMIFTTVATLDLFYPRTVWPSAKQLYGSQRHP